MTRTRGGLLLGAGLAIGIAVGAAGSALAASPAPAGANAAATTTPWSQMLDGLGGWGAGMMGGWTSNVSPSATVRPGMMGSLDPSQGAALQQACDQAHDAMHTWASGEAAPAPSTR